MLSLPIAITTQPPRPHLGGGEARGLLTSLGMFPSLSLPLLPPSSVQGCCGDEVLEEMSCRVLGCPGVSHHAQGTRMDRTSDLGTPHSSPFHLSSWHVSSVVHSPDPPLGARVSAGGQCHRPPCPTEHSQGCLVSLGVQHVSLPPALVSCHAALLCACGGR